MGLFDDVGDWLKGAANTVAGGFKDLYDDVLRPVGTTVFNGGVSLVNRAVNFTEKVADKGLDFADRTGQSVTKFSDMLSSPFLIIGIGIVAVIVLPQLLKK